jgi:hypothetical protein
MDRVYVYVVTCEKHAAKHDGMHAPSRNGERWGRSGAVRGLPGVEVETPLCWTVPRTEQGVRPLSCMHAGAPAFVFSASLAKFWSGLVQLPMANAADAVRSTRFWAVDNFS